jgi:hypothetical protein
LEISHEQWLERIVSRKPSRFPDAFRYHSGRRMLVVYATIKFVRVLT